LSGDNPTNWFTNANLGTDYLPFATCAKVAELQILVNYFNNGPLPTYSPTPNGTTTFNSNSFTYTLLTEVGLAGIFNQPGWAPGWGYSVPGL